MMQYSQATRHFRVWQMARAGHYLPDIAEEVGMAMASVSALCARRGWPCLRERRARTKMRRENNMKAVDTFCLCNARDGDRHGRRYEVEFQF